MSLKRNFINFFLAGLVAFAGIPAISWSALAADGEGLDAPEVAKTLKDNGDGTYTIALSVKGQKKSTDEATKANVVVVLDTSGSMSERSGRRTRMQVAKAAMKSLGAQLLAANNEKNPDMVEIAYIDFSTDVNSTLGPTTSLNTFNGWVDSAGTEGGTNWEAALKAANEVNFNDNDETYVLFVSDGNPTFRLSSHTATVTRGFWPFQYEEEVENPDDRNGIPAGVHGSGTDDEYGWNLNDAKTQAGAISSAGKNLYAIGAFGDANNMKSLGGTYYDASDEAALNAAFDDIVSQISNNLALTNIVFTDGITGETTAEISGEAGGFKYYKGVLSEGESDVTTLPSWEGAPAATFNNGVVKWDLGEETIENGQTAGVSFIVYPSQDVLDLIADLNNGKESWKEEYAEDIIKNGDSYSLRTNTAGTKMDYRVVNHKTVNGESTTELSEVMTAAIQNPDPVALYSEKLDVVKIWEDSLDGGSERGGIKEVVLDLYKDGQVYKEGIRLDASVTDDNNNWTLNEHISIAPGIMVGENHEAFALAEHKVSGTGADGGSVTYAFLEPGHDYEFKEEAIDGHFELNNNTFHPMLVDGELMNVKVTKGADGEVSGFEIVGAINGRVSATNTLKGGINIRKVVLGNDGNEISPKDTDGKDVKFKISAELKSVEGEAYVCEYKKYDAKGVSAVDDNGKEIKYACAQDGTLSEEISVGELVRVINVPAGTLYRVSEDESALLTGYGLREIQYEISAGSKDNYASDSAKNGYYTVLGNSASRATVINEYLTGKVKISKTVEVLSGNREQALAKEFGFTLSLNGKNGENLAEHEFTLKNGESKEFDEIPAGAHYTVKENEAAGFRTSSEGDEGTVAARETSEATFTNYYSVKPTSKEISAIKLFGLDDEWWREDEFIFALLDAQKQELERKTVNSLSKTATFTISIADEINSVYYISEIEEGFRGGVSRVANDADVVWEIKAVDQGDGTLAVSAQVKNEKDYIENQYEAEPVVFGDEGSDTETWLQVTKELEKSEEPSETQTFEFTLEFAGAFDEDGEEIPFEFEPQVVTIDGAGVARFEGFTFEEAGEYVFAIYENPGNAEFYSYDPSVYFLDIIVEDNNEGQLVIAETNLIRMYGNATEESSEIVFTNFYNPVSKGEVVIPKTPETGALSKVLEKYSETDNNTKAQTSTLMMILGMSIIMVLAGVSVWGARRIKK